MKHYHLLVNVCLHADVLIKGYHLAIWKDLNDIENKKEESKTKQSKIDKDNFNQSNQLIRKNNNNIQCQEF
mgnify:CR=1 FL=1